MAESLLASDALSSSSVGVTLRAPSTDREHLAALDVKHRPAAVAVVNRIAHLDLLRADAQHGALRVEHHLPALAVAWGDDLVADLHRARDVGGELEIVVVIVLDGNHGEVAVGRALVAEDFDLAAGRGENLDVGIGGEDVNVRHDRRAIGGLDEKAGALAASPLITTTAWPDLP